MLLTVLSILNHLDNHTSQNLPPSPVLPSSDPSISPTLTHLSRPPSWPTTSPPSSAQNKTKSVSPLFPLHQPLLTKKKKVNCSFYYKIGACRHGDRCSRKHVKPSYSQTILLPNLYQNPAYDPKNKMNASQLQNHFDAFYEDFWCEMCRYGEVEEVVVCDNNNDRSSTFPLPPFPALLSLSLLSLLSLFPSPLLTSIQPPLTHVCVGGEKQTSSATSTPASNTKIPPNSPATPSIPAGTPLDPSTASYPPSPISAKPAAVSTAAKGA